MLAILILAAALQAQPGAAKERPRAPERHVAVVARQPNKAEDRDSPANTPPVSVVVNNELPTPNGEDSKPQSQEARDEQRRLVCYTGWLVFVGAATAIFIWWQASETRTSAKAAMLNAQAIVNSQRAKLLFEIEKSFDSEEMRGVATFSIFVVNYGQTPAEIISYGKTEVCQTPTSLLPIPPEYQQSDPPTVRYLTPKGRHLIGDFRPGMPGAAYQMLVKVEGPMPDNVGDLKLTVYGQVLYKDGITELIRHSRYCSEFVREARVIGGRMELSGPAEYNECT